jgi:hypothetical protein
MLVAKGRGEGLERRAFVVAGGLQSTLALRFRTPLGISPHPSIAVMETVQAA